MSKRNEIFYRLHRLAEAGYCAELGRYRNERNVIRLFHPKKGASEISMYEDGSIDWLAVPHDHPFAHITVDDTELFERSINTIKLRAGWRSLFVSEIITRVHVTFLFSIPWLVVIIFGYWWWTRS